MTAKPKTKPPWRSGHCGIGNPPESHARCDQHPRADGVPCTCDCHQKTETIMDRIGFVHDLDERDYHGDRDSLSVSGAKLLLRAPALYRWRLDHPEHKDVFDYGSAAHRLVLGVGADLVEVEADSWRTNAAKDARAEARKAGKVALLSDDMRKVEAMADELSSHTLAMRLLSDGHPEVSAYAIDEETGVLMRGRFDWLGASVLTDYKSAATAEPAAWAGRYGVLRKWGYDLQAEWYLNLARLCGHPAAAFAFIAQEKEPPYLVSVVYVDETDLWEAHDRRRRALEIFRDCTDAGQWPGYLPDTTAARLSLTEQTYEEEKIA